LLLLSLLHVRASSYFQRLENPKTLGNPEGAFLVLLISAPPRIRHEIGFYGQTHSISLQTAKSAIDHLKAKTRLTKFAGRTSARTSLGQSENLPRSHSLIMEPEERSVNKVADSRPLQAFRWHGYFLYHYCRDDSPGMETSYIVAAGMLLTAGMVLILLRRDTHDDWDAPYIVAPGMLLTAGGDLISIAIRRDAPDDWDASYTITQGMLLTAGKLLISIRRDAPDEGDASYTVTQGTLLTAGMLFMSLRTACLRWLGCFFRRSATDASELNRSLYHYAGDAPHGWKAPYTITQGMPLAGSGCKFSFLPLTAGTLLTSSSESATAPALTVHFVLPACQRPPPHRCQKSPQVLIIPKLWTNPTMLLPCSYCSLPFRRHLQPYSWSYYGLILDVMTLLFLPSTDTIVMKTGSSRSPVHF
jgi:hypothetical protein